MIKSNEANTLVSTSYQKATENNLLWIANIKNLLELNGMACFYNKIGQTIPQFIHKKVFQRLSDKFHQEAFSTLIDKTSKLRTYGILKTEIGMES